MREQDASEHLNRAGSGSNIHGSIEARVEPLKTNKLPTIFKGNQTFIPNEKVENIANLKPADQRDCSNDASAMKDINSDRILPTPMQEQYKEPAGLTRVPIAESYYSTIAVANQLFSPPCNYEQQLDILKAHTMQIASEFARTKISEAINFDSLACLDNKCEQVNALMKKIIPHIALGIT